MKEYLSIGELANIFGMDVQLLRYYDARGILVPSVRNEANGRRYYHFDQVYPLATIRYLRKLDYSLDQIGAFISSGDVSQSLGSMAEQAGLLQQRCEELLATVTVLQKKIRFIQEESACAEEGTFRIKTYPERPYLPIGEEIDLFTYELFYFYPTVGFYSGDRKWFGAYLYAEQPEGTDHLEDLLAGQTVSYIPAGEYLCGYHYGPYLTIQNSIDRLLAESRRRGLVPDDCVVTPNIVDQSCEGHPENYVTGLEVRVFSTQAEKDAVCFSQTASPAVKAHWTKRQGRR